MHLSLLHSVVETFDSRSLFVVYIARKFLCSNIHDLWETTRYSVSNYAFIFRQNGNLANIHILDISIEK